VAQALADMRVDVSAKYDELLVSILYDVADRGSTSILDESK
jgi:hypothetical protein